MRTKLPGKGKCVSVYSALRCPAPTRECPPSLRVKWLGWKARCSTMQMQELSEFLPTDKWWRFGLTRIHNVFRCGYKTTRAYSRRNPRRAWCAPILSSGFLHNRMDDKPLRLMISSLTDFKQFFSNRISLKFWKFQIRHTSKLSHEAGPNTIRSTCPTNCKKSTFVSFRSPPSNTSNKL